MVPILSIVFMLFSLAVVLLLTVGLYLFLRKRFEMKILPALIGAAAFILFAMILERLLHMAVLRPGPDGSVALIARPFLYMLYGALAAGVFEETARFVSFHLLKKRCKGFGTALKYGVGHGGIEAVIVGGVSLVSSLVLSVMINANGAQAVDGAIGGTVLLQAQGIASTQPFLFFVSGAERLLALVIQISLSVVVYYAVYEQRRLWLFPLAILLHALVDCPAVLMQAGVFTNVWLVEGMIAVCAAALVFFAVALHKRLEPKETEAA